ncbi:hypothetical protein [Pseudomonas aeruginosa]|uniref:hypothetical protein n=1 Tax=Pseudomonas aeruginosa TaxID=287 RepID=UPI0020126D16|nr:hypothetical protein [Pseudomonas aeruginosa]
MKQSEFRAELVKIMPGYNWTVHKSHSPDTYLIATGIQSSGSNRLSTLRVERREAYAGSGSARYEVKSAGYGRRAPWLHIAADKTLARALRALQDHYERTASLYWSHAGHMKTGRKAVAAAPGKEVPQAWLDVQAERRRQIEAEGWTPEHDDEHDTGALASAAGCYAMFSLAYPAGDPSRFWPWDKSWWKPSPDGRRNMVKAGALILAEIERLDRATASQGGPSDA